MNNQSNETITRAAGNTSKTKQVLLRCSLREKKFLWADLSDTNKLAVRVLALVSVLVAAARVKKNVCVLRSKFLLKSA